MPGEKKCFFVCPIGLENSDSRRRSDEILDYVLKPVLERYTVQRADQIASPGMITNDIVHHLIHDDLVIADLTDHNPNVMYELAVRHAYRKPVIQMISRDQVIPFDVGNQRTIFYDIGHPSSTEELKKSLRKVILGIENGENDGLIENPIMNAELLKEMRMGTRNERALAIISERLGQIHHELMVLRDQTMQGFAESRWHKDSKNEQDESYLRSIERLLEAFFGTKISQKTSGETSRTKLERQKQKQNRP